MASVTLRGVSKSYGDVAALEPLDLEIKQGEFVTLLGPSGCGKTTTLRLIAGFLKPSQGRILFGGDDVTELPPHRREFGMVFQDYALFPHMTIGENIAFGLVERGRPKAEIDARVRELLQLIQLKDVEKRYPTELSGGQQQRVAVARAVAHSPQVLLMDEPLGALDLKLRESMQYEIRSIQQRIGITTVYVTHDQTEAMNMSDRIAVMNKGRLEQIGSGVDIYQRPSTRFVADFIGQINLVSAITAGPGLETSSVTIAGRNARIAKTMMPGLPITIGIRPEQIALRRADDAIASDDNALPGKVASRQFSGNVMKIWVDVGLQEPIMLDFPPRAAPPEPGDAVAISWPVDGAVVLPE